ncbi:MAG TPA: rhodanese-like domain-containing protein, partial [Planctomycetaceae bacterium]
KRMKKVNAEGPAILGPELPGRKRFTSKDLHDRLCENCLVVDVRSKEAYAAAHIPGSVNIPLGPNLPTWAGWVLPYDRSLVIVADHTSDVPDVVTHLIRVGLDDVEGYLDDGMDAWENHGYEISRLETVSVRDLAGRLKDGSAKPFVLDVRTDSEWDAGHIDDARHIHGGLLKERYSEVPKDRPVAVICGSGYRGSIAASFLKREGYADVANVLGGMTAWKNAGLPTV